MQAQHTGDLERAVEIFAAVVNKLTRDEALNIDDVKARVRLSSSTIYKLIREGDFPKARQLAQGRTAWLASDIDHWLKSRPDADPAQSRAPKHRDARIRAVV